MDEAKINSAVVALRRGDPKASVELYEFALEFPKRAGRLVAPLADALSNLETRDFAAFALAEIGPLAAYAVPQLIDAMRYDPENYVAIPFALALGKIGSEAKIAVPALIEALSEGDPSVDACVAEALGLIGPDAATAIPALENLIQETQEDYVREAALVAIKLIIHS